MQTLIDYAALLFGAAVFGLLVWASIGGWPDHSGRPLIEHFIPGNYHPHAHYGDDGGQN